MDNHDLLVIGAGPGGYVAAIRAAQLGMKVACIDKRVELGGTCLNVGCIPSKTLLESSEHYYQMKHRSALHGIQVDGNVSVDLPKMMKRKDEVIKSTVQGIQYLINKNKITFYQGEAAFVNNKTVEIKNKKKQTITVGAKSILIATGSAPIPLSFLPFDEKYILSSTGALSLSSVPEDLILIGGGVIGVEIGSIYARLGTKVTVIEYTDRIIPALDSDLGKELETSLKKLGFQYHFNSLVKAGEVKKNKKVTLSVEKDGQIIELESEVALVCVGRKPYTESLNLKAIGVEMDEKGFIPIDDAFKTSAANVYAIGDVVRGPMLAHKASEEGFTCVEIIAGKKSNINYKTIPSVVYTWPEVACVGRSEQDLKREGIAYKKGVFPFKASGRARAAAEDEGFVKILTDKNTDEVLGIHMIGPRASDMIGNAVLAMEYRATGEDLALIPYAHPTYLEAVKEAALMATDGRAIHL